MFRMPIAALCTDSLLQWTQTQSITCTVDKQPKWRDYCNEKRWHTTADYENHFSNYTHTHTRLTALCSGLPRLAGTRQVKPIWILLEQEIVSGSGISLPICKSAPPSRQITMPASHHSVFYRQDALPDAQPTASKHWRTCYVTGPHS